MIIAFAAEMLLGLYQLFHAFVISIIKLVNKTFSWLFGIYWILVLLIILGWAVMLFASNFNSFGDDVILISVMTGWLPIIYYIIISFIDLRKMLKT